MNHILQELRKIESPVGVAVSGGADSMVLLHLLLEAGHHPVVMHVNYRKRGISSEKDEALVHDFALKHGILFFCKRMDDEPVGNFQAWARDVRYQWFREIKDALGLKTMLTAHHQDDQLETLLFRLLRGASLSSLSGIRKNQGGWFRPLLDIPKQHILEYAEEKSIPWRIDESNLSDDFDRNSIRIHLVPALDRSYPDWREKLLDVPFLSSFYRETMKSLLEECLINGNLKRDIWLRFSENIQRSLLKDWIFKKTGIQVSKSFLMQHQSIITLQTGKFVEVNEDVIILRNRDLFILQKRESLKYPHKLNVSIDQDELTEGFQEYFGKIFIKRGKWQGKPGRNVLELDALQLKWPIKIRNWKAGDRIRPLGMSGTKLISDVLTEHRISVVQKNEAFVLESFDGNLCAVIFPRTYKERTGIISEDVRCSSLTTTTLILSHYNS